MHLSPEIACTFQPCLTWNMRWCRLRQIGCPIAQGNHFLVQATMIYIIFAWRGKYKSEVNLTNLINQVKNIKNYILIRYKPSTYNDFLTLHIVFLFGHVWASGLMANLARPGNQEERKLSQPAVMSRPLSEGDIKVMIISPMDIYSPA